METKNEENTPTLSADELVHRRTSEALAKRAAELEVVAQVSIATATILNSQELLQTVVDLTQVRFKLEVVNIGLYDESRQLLYLAACAGALGLQLLTQKMDLPLNQTPSLVAQAARTRQSIAVNDVRHHPDYWAPPELADIRSELVVPIVIGDKLLGVLDVQSNALGRFSQDDVRIFTILAAQIGIALQNARRFEKIQKVAAELAESQQFLDSIIEHIPTPLFVKEAESLRLVRSNQANERLVGRKREDLLGKTDDELFPKAEADFYSAKDREILATGRPLDIPEQHLHSADGQVRILHTRKVPIVDSEGKPKYVLGISEDITERKRLEQQIKESWERRGRQVQTSTEVAQQIAAAPALDELFQRVVQLIQARFRYYYVQVYTLEETELVMQAGSGEIGKQLKAAGHKIPLTREVSLVAQAARTGEAVLAKDVQQEPRWLPNRLLPATLAEIAVPIKLSQRVLGILDVQSDVVGGLTTEDELLLTGLCGQIAIAMEYRRVEDGRIQAEAQLKSSLAELERSHRELQEFAYISSHDLQEPLRKIQAFSDRFQDQYQAALDERGLDYLARMQKAAARMQKLIHDLLAFSRVTTRTHPFRLINVAEIVEEVLLDLEMNLQEVGAQVILGDLPAIEADPVQIGQIFQILISNAAKFRQAEIPLIIHIKGYEVAEPAGHCQFVVTDNGIGFDEKYRERIFGVFQRLHGRTEYEGTGVGLAVCRRIVERHHGRITATSAPGQGSTFIITLPRHQPPQPE
jgi:PAS domain S-box-containing protein